MAYTIQSGDTLSKLATANKTTVAELMKANPNIKDANKIQAGASLNLTKPASMGVQATSPYTMPTAGVKPLQPSQVKQTLPTLAKSKTGIPGTVPINAPQTNNQQMNLPGTVPLGSTKGVSGGGYSTPAYNAEGKPNFAFTPSTKKVEDDTMNWGKNKESVTTPKNENVVQTGSVNSDKTAEQYIQDYKNSQNNTYNSSTASPSSSGQAPTPTPTPTPTPKPQQDITQQGLLQELLRKGEQKAAEIREVEMRARERAGAERMAFDTEGYQSARAGNIANVASGQTASLGKELENIGGLYGKALSATAPQLQAGMLTNPLTGQPLNPSLVSNAVQQASFLVQNGTDINSPQVQALLNPFGYYGASAMSQAMQALSGGTFNATAQSAYAQNTASLGTEAQTQSVHLDTALKNVENIAQPMLGLLRASGLNPTDTKLANIPINQYIETLGNTDAAKQMSLMLGDVSKFTGQILATNAGGIPSDVSATMSSIDPSTLSYTQLKHYLEMAHYLGGMQHKVSAQQVGNMGGTQGTYTGSLSSEGAMPTNTPNTGYGSGVTGIPQQIAAGTGIMAGEIALQAASQGVPALLGFVLGKVTGGTSGAVNK